jgi:hypothetical protein
MGLDYEGDSSWWRRGRSLPTETPYCLGIEIKTRLKVGQTGQYPINALIGRVPIHQFSMSGNATNQELAPEIRKHGQSCTKAATASKSRTLTVDYFTSSISLGRHVLSKNEGFGL